jgi:mono/diheme cytochrome c family protein
MTKTSANLLSRLTLTGVFACALFVAGCRQDMADQPKYKALTGSDFFGDGRSGRPLIDNTVSRNSYAENALYESKDSNAIPVPVDAMLLERGEDRYRIYCSPCHGIQGDGNGMIAERGMKHPPTYHQDRMRKVTNGYLFDVITNGFGAMYGYSAQIAPKDRWAIVAYIRALQLSRNAKASDLPADAREKVMNPPPPAAKQQGETKE